MNNPILPLLRCAGLTAVAAIGLVGVTLRADSPAAGATSDAFARLDNYVTLGVGGANPYGNKAAYEELMHESYNGFAGVEDMHYAKDLSKDASLTIDGHALAGSDDYLGQVNLTRTDFGSLDIGYKRFRTYYDGVGGFFPVNKQWLPLADQVLATDRAKFWAEATINLPNMPVFKVKYTSELRSGTKDSTIWGDSDLTGLAFNLAPNPVSPARKLVPSYLQLDERHQMLEASVTHTIGRTTFMFELTGDKTDNLDSRFVTRFPGEVIPWSIAKLSTTLQPAQKALVAATNWNNQILLQQTDGENSQTGAAILKVDSVLTDKITLHVGGQYQHVQADMSGNRPLVTNTPTSTGVVPVTTATFSALTGHSDGKVTTGNLAIDFKPIPDLFLRVAVRAEHEDIKGASGYNVLAASGTPAVTVATTPRLDWENINQHSATPAVDLRYTGIKNLSLYFTGSKRDLKGDEQNSAAYNPLTATAGALALNNNSEDHGDYKFGADWRAFSMLELRAEYFDQHHQYESAGYGAQLGDYYLLDSQFKGVKLTAVAKPLAELSFTTRYIYQHGTMQVTGFLPTYPAYDSCNAKNYNISETIDWVPNKAVYFQASGSLVYNTIDTVYPRAGVTPATSTVAAWDTNRVLHNSNNNYSTMNLLAGFVAAKDADIEAQYTYYRADNGDPAMAALTMPYGADAEEYVASVGLKLRLDNRRILHVKVGYAESLNGTTGGFTNFHGPLGYVSLDYAL